MWLFVPPTCLPSVREEEASNSASTSPSLVPALWVTLSGKPTQRPLSSPIWRSRRWVKVLSGTTLPPSTAARGVESWISSLAATRASLSAPQESDSERRTPATCGLTSLASSLRSSRNGASSRTSQTTLTLGSRLSEPSYGRWAIALRQDCSRRLRLARARNASGFTSWPTARANEGSSGSWQRDPRTGEINLTLTGAVKAWHTPLTADDGQKVSPASTRESLMRQAQNWGTPTVGTSPAYGQAQPTRTSRLKDQASNWPTPNASNVNDGKTLESWEARQDRERAKHHNGNGMGTPLAIAALQWRSPRAPGPGSGGPSVTRLDQPHPRYDLQDQTAGWPTPTAGQHGKDLAALSRGGTSKGEQLPNFVEHHFPPTATTAPDGPPSSSTALTSRRRLNPAFVEWLMGWPAGWAVAGTTNCGCSETEWSRWEQLMGFCLSSLEWLRTEAV
jgi:hypothetical protein